MGVSGCGKSSVGQALAEAIGGLYVDGDDLHPPGNIAKMSAGLPLSDEDRWPWLEHVGKMLASSEATIIIGCSALRKTYRDRIREMAGSPVFFLHLSGTKALIAARMQNRPGHFMPVSLLDSQFAALEPLSMDEQGATVNIDQTLPCIVADTISNLRPEPEQEPGPG